MSVAAKARVFRSGNSQAVRLPREFRFRSSVVEIYRRGDEVVLRESAATLEQAFDLLAGLSQDFFAGGREDAARSRTESGKLSAGLRPRAGRGWPAV